MPYSASEGLAPWAVMQMAFPAWRQALSEVLKPAEETAVLRLPEVTEEGRLEPR